MPFAVFAIAFSNNLICATTRDDKSIGLPGGKVDKGETPEMAVIRESEEEGFIVKNPVFFRSAIVDGKEVQWFTCDFVKKLDQYKEKSRGITPVFVPVKEVAGSFGNGFLLEMN